MSAPHSARLSQRRMPHAPFMAFMNRVADRQRENDNRTKVFAENVPRIIRAADITLDEMVSEQLDGTVALARGDNTALVRGDDTALVRGDDTALVRGGGTAVTVSFPYREAIP